MALAHILPKKYNLKFLIYYEEYQYIQEAISREKELKGWRREKKFTLIKENNPDLKDLSKELLEDYTYEDIQEILEALKENYKYE